MNNKVTMEQINKMIPELRFPEFVNDGEWEEKELKNVVEINPKAKKLPENFIWMTLNQLYVFIKFNNYLNIQARNLIATISFV